MADKKNWGSTVMGWFIVQDPAEGQDAPQDHDAVSDEELIQRAAAGQSASAEEPLEVFTSEPPPAPGGEVAFESVYEAAGITSEESTLR